MLFLLCLLRAFLVSLAISFALGSKSCLASRLYLKTVLTFWLSGDTMTLCNGACIVIVQAIRYT